ncbi:MAG: SRPBCC family protein [Chloroflexi bacterium]|nr:SRPBCC family protein [Chloroflexota bacterium]MYE41016.1 SRPBCC family protein [Chloroflexota bacterium]
MPDFHLSSSVLLHYPLSEVFDFFASAENLNLLTPPWLHFSILTRLPIEMQRGTVIQYRLKLHGIPVRWDSEITEWEPPFRFTDTQIRGPYRLWVHYHRFENTPDGTLVADDVTYRVAGGALVNRLFVANDLRRIFDYRKAKLLELYP